MGFEGGVDGKDHVWPRWSSLLLVAVPFSAGLWSEHPPVLACRAPTRCGEMHVLLTTTHTLTNSSRQHGEDLVLFFFLLKPVCRF